MRLYEVMYILRPDLEEEKVKDSIEQYQNVIKENGGEVKGLNEMGKRRFAYEINDFREGYYVVMNIEAEHEAVKEMERQMKISENVIRFLVVREDEE